MNINLFHGNIVGKTLLFVKTVVFINQKASIRGPMKMPSYYAVRVGKVPGVYLTWKDCVEQVHKYPGAEYKKFPTEELAREFVKDSKRWKQKETTVVASTSSTSHKHENQEFRPLGCLAGPSTSKKFLATIRTQPKCSEVVLIDSDNELEVDKPKPSSSTTTNNTAVAVDLPTESGKKMDEYISILSNHAGTNSKGNSKCPGRGILSKRKEPKVTRLERSIINEEDVIVIGDDSDDDDVIGDRVHDLDSDIIEVNHRSNNNDDIIEVESTSDKNGILVPKSRNSVVSKTPDEPKNTVKPKQAQPIRINQAQTGSNLHTNFNPNNKGVNNWESRVPPLEPNRPLTSEGALNSSDSTVCPTCHRPGFVPFGNINNNCAWLKGNQHNRKRSRSRPQPDYLRLCRLEGEVAKLMNEIGNKNAVKVYTDGACIRNGSKTAKAGIGVWWGDGDPLNISEPLLGRQTNNRAEIHAAVRALEIAKVKGERNIILYTDSQFLINGITKWIHDWKKKNWKLASGGTVCNKDDFEALDRARAGLTVKWVYVKGHCGIHGNEMADLLATSAIKGL